MVRAARSVKPARKGGNVRRAANEADLGFWNRPALMNLVADLLYFAAAIMLVCAGWAAVQRMPVLPLRHLVVKSSLQHVSAGQLEQSARSALNGNFLTVDLDAARRAFESIPWVRHVDVRRRWPDTVELLIDEHEAVAYWTPRDGESRLVNRYGEVFAADSDAALPHFFGPENTAPQVLARFNEFSSAMKVIGMRVAAVQLSAREAWRLRLADGVIIDLGRDQDKIAFTKRLERFAATYAQIRAHVPVAFNTVDMRYPNGFAVRTDAASIAKVDS